MADNDLVILGPPISVVLCKLPSSISLEHRQMFSSIDIIGVHDEFFIIMCRQRKLARLREAGAEVIMLEPDANHYMERISTDSEQELLAFIDERRDQGREELRIADRGRDRDQDQEVT